MCFYYVQRHVEAWLLFRSKNKIKYFAVCFWPYFLLQRWKSFGYGIAAAICQTDGLITGNGPRKCKKCSNGDEYWLAHPVIDEILKFSQTADCGVLFLISKVPVQDRNKARNELHHTVTLSSLKCMYSFCRYSIDHRENLKYSRCMREREVLSSNVSSDKGLRT